MDKITEQTIEDTVKIQPKLPNKSITQYKKTENTHGLLETNLRSITFKMQQPTTIKT